MSEPVAAIDCGTNTIKLLVGDPVGDPVGVRRESRMIRLGQGVDATGRLAPEALERAWVAIDELAAIVRAVGVGPERTRFCATSATRDASNAGEFAAGVHARLGIAPEVLSGEEEARLAFAGAVRGLTAASVELRGPTLVVDIGGGSTELILGDPATGPRAAHSMDIGSVRLHERHVRHDPITPAEIAAVVADVDTALDACPVDPAAARSVVAVAGTNTTIAAGTLGLAAYDRELIHARALAVPDLLAQVERLLALSVAERRALGWMHPGRADVIDAGALILARVLARLSVEVVTVAETDILDGIAWSLLS
ncbi:Ppx/GppA phosphatase family protein [Nocardioides nitrophenolicus]|uniref:Ppx/GppA phosphatase family protein n=1 Tax=Nocardioides nitrophenolicus TaxID=60489 RepID=UPI001959ACD1|nr:exopolyphosphatase [Nocardioides nitrophenolicus]MBM7515820.1 exopolyphosphatase/guanosine-5'-triphosphate,3'-diphosphate pyrophosphatase [Nocardioides nitrophenolicus]